MPGGSDPFASFDLRLGGSCLLSARPGEEGARPEAGGGPARPVPPDPPCHRQHGRRAHIPTEVLVRDRSVPGDG